jgi:hypothetical protein
MAFGAFSEHIIPAVEAAQIPREVKSVAKRLGAHTASKISVVLASRIPRKYRDKGRDEDLETLVKASGMVLIRMDTNNINKIRSCIKRYITSGRQVWMVSLYWYEYSSVINGGVSWNCTYAVLSDGEIPNSAAVCARIRGGEAVIDVHQS